MTLYLLFESHYQSVDINKLLQYLINSSKANIWANT